MAHPRKTNRQLEPALNTIEESPQATRSSTETGTRPAATEPAQVTTSPTQPNVAENLQGQVEVQAANSQAASESKAPSTKTTRSRIKAARKPTPSCASIFYSSASCQGQDAALHALVCGKYDEFLGLQPRDGLRHGERDGDGDGVVQRKLALLLPWDAEEVEFVWVGTVERGVFSGLEAGEVVRFFGEDGMEGWEVRSWVVRGRAQEVFMGSRMSSELQGEGDREGKGKGEEDRGRNKCLEALLRRSEVSDRDVPAGGGVHGNMLVLSWSRDAETGAERYHDVVPGDLRWALDHIVQFGLWGLESADLRGQEDNVGVLGKEQGVRGLEKGMERMGIRGWREGDVKS